MNEPRVGVVTPLYNCEKYLAECIESIIRQTYSNWEYTIINNCSTDRSGEIAQKYAEQDYRIQVIHNNYFLTQFQNWNYSMRQISLDSLYCKVVHADDWLFPECLEKMVAVAEANPTVGIVGSYRLDEFEVNLDGLPFPSTVVPGKEICRTVLLGGPYLFGSPTSLLIRSQICKSRNPFYNENSIHADTEACFDILSEWDFGFVHQVLTFTRRHNETVTASISNLNSTRFFQLEGLIKYGPYFLSAEEYNKRLEKVIHLYSTFWVKMRIKKNAKNVLEYHRDKMKELGIYLNSSKLIKAFIIEGIRVLMRRVDKLLHKIEKI